MIDQLTQLADEWLASACRSYINAGRMHESLEDRPTGKIMTEHGANCQIHCAIQLKELLSSLSASASETPKKMKSKVKPQT